MKISVDSLIKKLIWLMTVFLFFSVVVYNEASWGKYTVLLVSFLIALFAAILGHGKIGVRVEAYYIFIVLFALYSLVSALWAIRSSDAITKGMTVLQIFLCAFMMYLYYKREENVHALVTAVMWAGYLIALYTIGTYGIDYVMGAITGKRMTDLYNNVNTLGMSVAISCVLQVNELMNKRGKWSALLMIPSILVVLASQSRKALLMVLIGILLLYVIKALQNGGNVNKLLKSLLFLAVLIGVIFLLLRLPIFSVAKERIETMFAALLEGNSEDGSTVERMAMIRLGWQIFQTHPLLGIGIGNTHIMTAQYLYKDTYLHSNFMELLAGGGIIGFCLYYAMYVYLFVNLFRYRKADQEYFTICLTWLILMLVMDYGAVTYYSKTQWFYLMIQFLNVRNLQKKSRELSSEGKETD